MDGFISNIQPFSLQDGPGIRTTVFMKGCNLRCFWCHNPEAILPGKAMQFFQRKCIGCGDCVRKCPNAINGKTARFTDMCTLCGKCVEVCSAEALVLTGRKISADELMEVLEKDYAIFKRSGGGLTFSGGEPLLQKDFVLEIFARCRKAKISTAIETALNVMPQTVNEVLPLVDTFICDLKTTDNQKHISGTGVSNKQILENISMVVKEHRNVLIRTPIIPDFNDTQEDMRENADFLSSLGKNLRVELLPFHGVCESKYQSMNLVYQASGRKTPGKELMRSLAQEYKAKGLSVKYE